MRSPSDARTERSPIGRFVVLFGAVVAVLVGVRWLMSPDLERRNFEFFPDMAKTWGLSFMINTERAPTGRSPGSLAWAGLANTDYVD